MDAESQMIIAATREVFTMMIGLDPLAGTPREERIRFWRDGVSGMIGLSGAFRGMVAVHCPSSVAIAITSQMLGMDVTEIGTDVKDAFGELSNMIAGGLKTALAAQGTHVDLSVPTTVSGSAYELNCLTQARCDIIPFSVSGGEFLVEFKRLSNV